MLDLKDRSLCFTSSIKWIDQIWKTLAISNRHCLYWSNQVKIAIEFFWNLMMLPMVCIGNFNNCNIDTHLFKTRITFLQQRCVILSLKNQVRNRNPHCITINLRHLLGNMLGFRDSNSSSTAPIHNCPHSIRIFLCQFVAAQSHTAQPPHNHYVPKLAWRRSKSNSAKTVFDP